MIYYKELVLTELMATFKLLLSPKTRYSWYNELEEARSKLEIGKKVKEGVRMFDPPRVTNLSPDLPET